MPSASEPRTADRHLTAALRTELALRNRERVALLDAGCGEGRLLSHVCGALGVDGFGFDVKNPRSSRYETFPAQTIESLTRRHPTVDWSDRVRICGPDDPWPFAADTFDVVLSQEVLEHAFDIEHFMHEQSRVLRPGGFGIHLFPLRSVLMEWHLRVPFAHRIKSHHAREQYLRLVRHPRPEFNADYLQFGTRYYSASEVFIAAKKSHLRASFRYVPDFYFQRLRARDRYGSRSALMESAWSLALRFVESITLLVERPLQ